MARATILIPARLSSTRLPRKLLREIQGESVIRHTINQCLRVENVRVVVLAEDQEIVDHISDLTECYLTPEAKNGTERIIKWLDNVITDVVINVQADEPFTSPRDLERMIQLMDEKTYSVITLDRNLHEYELRDRNCVKLLKHMWDDVAIFTRSPLFSAYTDFKKHIGIYGFKWGILKKIGEINPTPSSINDSLEQVSWMEHGINIISIRTPENYISIDSELDLKKANEYANGYEEI